MIYRIREDTVYDIEADSATEAMSILMAYLTFVSEGVLRVRNVEVLDREILGATTLDGTPAEMAEDDVEEAMALSRA